MCSAPRFLISALLLVFTGTIWAAGPPADGLLAHSAFLRGYFAGYQEGFHNGNLDLQLGRTADPSRYRRHDTGYNSTLGDRKTYEEGYRRAFLVAYADAFQGRPFRALDGLWTLARSLPGVNGSSDMRAVDAALVEGYRAGMRKGLDDGRAGLPDAVRDTSLSRTDQCSGNASSCSTYAAAFRLGYTDGYLNQQRPNVSSPAVTTASK